jgi:hypothetical protein
MRYPATELAVRDYLRTQASLIALLANDTRRIDFKAPADDRPCIVIYRVGGFTSDYLPLDTATLAADCWGGSFKASLDLKTELKNSLSSIVSVMLNAETYGGSASVVSDLWTPDPGGRARHTVTFVVSARLTAAAA